MTFPQLLQRDAVGLQHRALEILSHVHHRVNRAGGYDQYQQLKIALALGQGRGVDVGLLGYHNLNNAEPTKVPNA